MPSRKTVEHAQKDLREGKSPSTAAGEFVREEIEHIREGKHGARSTEQAIAIGLAKARRAGIPLKPPAKGKTSSRTRKSATKDYESGQRSPKARAPNRKRSAASTRRLKQEPHTAASKAALSRHAKRVAKRKG
ncbi:MAG: transcription elongation factor [Gemmatimonadota bacterium]